MSTQINKPQPNILQKKLTYYKDLVESGIVNDNTGTKKNILNLKYIEKNSTLKYYRDMRDCGLISNKHYNNMEVYYNKKEEEMKKMNEQKFRIDQQQQQKQQQQPIVNNQQQFIQQQQQQQQQQKQPSNNNIKNIPIKLEQNEIPPLISSLSTPISQLSSQIPIQAVAPINEPVKHNMFTLDTYFDKIYISNLERRTDRLQLLKTRLEKNNIKNYQIVKAYDGNHPQIKNEFQMYLRNKKSRIHTSGALGYLYTMKHILTDAINNNYNRILICDDDIIFHNDFVNYFDLKIKGLNNFKWKLLYLGASQLNYWNKVSILNTEYYLPNGTTDGSFAVGIDRSVLSELLQTLNGNILPFDTGPLRYIQTKYSRECLVMYPNIVIADVRNSDIQSITEDASQHLITFSNKCKWNLIDYSFT